MDRTEFIRRLEELHHEYAVRVGRTLNKNALGDTWRRATRYITWIFYNLGLTGNQVTVLHLTAELGVVWLIALDELLIAFLMLALSHVLDNADGDLARIRGQENPGMTEIDELGHLVTNVLFWLVVYYQVPEGADNTVIILGATVLLKWFRRGVANKDRIGQRSNLWMWIVKPTNVMVIYIAFILLAAWGFEAMFVRFYAIYFTAGVVYLSYQNVQKVLRA